MYMHFRTAALHVAIKADDIGGARSRPLLDCCCTFSAMMLKTCDVTRLSSSIRGPVIFGFNAVMVPTILAFFLDPP